jgi:two-component system, cell cycle sensor histidine kinase and response regulator CckA
MNPAPEVPRRVVLLVEDERSLLEITTLRLEDLGCKIFGAEGPEQAIALFDEHGKSIDFVFTDLRMGGIGGQGLIEHLIGLDNGVRIVATSALLDELDSVRARWGDRVRLMLKPYDLEELKVLLRIEQRD